MQQKHDTIFWTDWIVLQIIEFLLVGIRQFLLSSVVVRIGKDETYEIFSLVQNVDQISKNGSKFVELFFFSVNKLF